MNERVPENLIHIKKHRGLWHLLKGTRVIARQPGKQKGQSYFFDFLEFLRFAKGVSALYKTKKKRRKPRSFEKQMQFYTAYWYGLQREQGIYNESKTVNDDEYAFYQLMCRIDSSTARSWKDSGSDAEDWGGYSDDEDSELDRRARDEARIDFMLNEDT